MPPETVTFQSPLDSLIAYAELVHAEMAEVNAARSLPTIHFASEPACTLYVRGSQHRSDNMHANNLARELRTGHPHVSLHVQHPDSTFGVMGLVFRHLYARYLCESGASRLITFVDDLVQEPTVYLPANSRVLEYKPKRVMSPKHIVDVAEVTAGHVAVLMATGIDLATVVAHKARAAAKPGTRFCATGPQIFFKREGYMLEAYAWVEQVPIVYEAIDVPVAV